MYKILKEVVEENTQGSRSESNVACLLSHPCYHTSGAKVSLSGRVRDQAGKEMLAKQLQGLQANLPSFLDMNTGTIKARKPKKEKTAEEEAVAELKKLEKKSLELRV